MGVAVAVVGTTELAGAAGCEKRSTRDGMDGPLAVTGGAATDGLGGAPETRPHVSWREWVVYC